MEPARLWAVAWRGAGAAQAHMSLPNYRGQCPEEQSSGPGQGSTRSPAAPQASQGMEWVTAHDPRLAELGWARGRCLSEHKVLQASRLTLGFRATWSLHSRTG